MQVRQTFIDILEDEVCLRCGPAPELKQPQQSSAVTSLFKFVSLQVGSQHTSRTRGVTCTVNQPSTSTLNALQLTPPIQEGLEIISHPPPPHCLPHHSSPGGTTGPRMQALSAYHTPIHTTPPPQPPAALLSSLLCPPCGLLASEQRSRQPRLHRFCLLRSALPLQKALQCPLVSRLSMTALKRFTATSTVTSPPYIFDLMFVCLSVCVSLKYLCQCVIVKQCVIFCMFY